MKITLIQCPAWSIVAPPYNLALLKSVLQYHGHQVRCHDLNIELYHHVKNSPARRYWTEGPEACHWFNRNLVYELLSNYHEFIDEFIKNNIAKDPANVIGFSVTRQSRFATIRIAGEVRKRAPGKIIVLGGPECFHGDSWSELLEETQANAACLGEGEICFPELLNQIEVSSKFVRCKGFAFLDDHGGIVNCGDPDVVEDLNSLPFADFSDFDFNKYERKNCLPILTSKGCMCRCSFCSESVKMGRYRTRSGQNVYSEISRQLGKYPHLKEFHFNDSLLNGSIKMLDELCDLLIENNIEVSWGGQALIRKEMTKEFLAKMRKAGCGHFGYGVESGSNRILKLMRRPYTAELANEVIRNTYEAGIKPNFNVILGFPYETDKEFQETLGFMRLNARFADHVWINLLGITPFSELNLNREKWGVKPSGEFIIWENTDGRYTRVDRLERLKKCLDLSELKGKIMIAEDLVTLQ